MATLYTPEEIPTIVDQLFTSDSPATNALKIQVEETGLQGEEKSAYIAKLRTSLIKNMTDGADPAILPTEENKKNEQKKAGIASNMSAWFGNLLGMFSGTLQTAWSFVSSFMPDAVTNLFSKPAEQVVSLTNGENQDDVATKRQEAGIYNALVSTKAINNGKRVGITDPGIVMEIVANARNNGLLPESWASLNKDNDKESLSAEELRRLDVDSSGTLIKSELPPALRAQFDELLKAANQAGDSLNLAPANGFTAISIPKLVAAAAAAQSK